MIKINDNIKKMADLLRSGNTMLNIACPVCNNPIFRNKGGNTFCPSCNRNVLFVEDSSIKDNTLEQGETYQEEQEKDRYNRKVEILSSIEDTILEKIEIINEKLSSENQVQEIEMYIKILINCLDLLSKLPFRKEK